MSNIDRPFGFIPYGPVLRARYYACPTAPTINISVGDIVLADNSAVVSAKLGLILSIYDAAVPSGVKTLTYPVLGVVLACFDENMDPVQYIAAAETGDSTVGGYFLVADHPDQQFVAQTDGDLTDANLNLNFDITTVALCAPDSSAKTYLSTMEIDVDSTSTTADYPLRLYGQAYPDDSHAAAGCRMIVQINPGSHQFGAANPV